MSRGPALRWARIWSAIVIAGDWSTFGTWCAVVGRTTRWTPSSSSVTSPGPSGNACTAANGPTVAAAWRRRLISSSALSSVKLELRPVGGEPGDVGSQRVPVLRAVDVQVGGVAGEASQRVGERAGCLARLRDAERDELDVDPAAGLLPRRRAEVDGAGHTTGGRVAAEVAVVLVEPQRQRVGAVDVASMTGSQPSSRYFVSSESTRGVVHRDRARHDQQVLVAALPQHRDHGRHQPQHAAGALELVERRPVLVEPVEQLGMDRVRQLHPPPVLGLADLAREVGRLLAVEVAERLDHAVADPGLVRASSARTAGGGRSRSSRRPRPASTGRTCGARRCFSRASASLPPSPPTSMSLAGIDTSTTTFGTAAAASVSAWAKVNWVSKSPPTSDGSLVPRRELAGVGHPLVDQHDRRAQRAGTGRSACRPGSSRPVLGLDELVARRHRRAGRRSHPTACAPRCRRPSPTATPARSTDRRRPLGDLGRQRRASPRRTARRRRAGRRPSCPTPGDRARSSSGSCRHRSSSAGR